MNRPIQPPRRRRPLPRPEGLSLMPAGVNGRDELERQVARVFARVHGATIAHFHDLLLGLRDARGRLLGVIGTTPAVAHQMFLETYLDEPVEQRLGSALGRELPRGRITEVGNLASAHPGAALPLVTTLAHALREGGWDWSVFTATESLRRCFDRMGATLIDLAAADGQRLGDDLQSWGRYYGCDPRVVAVHVPTLCTVAAGRPELAGPLAPSWARAAQAMAALAPTGCHA